MRINKEDLEDFRLFVEGLYDELIKERESE